MIQLSRNPHARIRLDDVARVEQSHGCREVAGVFEEKRAQFRKVNGITLVDGELRLIALHVAEVGVDRSIEDHCVAPHCLHFASRGGLGIARAEVGIVGVERLERVFVLRQRVGIDLHIMRARDPFDPAQGAFLAECSAHARRNARPPVVFAVARQVTPEHHAPVVARGRKSQAAEWKRNQRHPALTVIRASESHTWS